ncbi:MAG TPA: nucleotide exchange factor GrpE [Firmicutes bacterium]|nr:nucleotide exchange factor GrpE [Bacillota bacterium]
MQNTEEKNEGNAQTAQPESEAERVRQQLEKELEEARKKAEENWDLFLRARADFDNYRKRVEADAAKRIYQAQAETVLKILDVRDNLDRALASPDSTDTAGIKRGVEMVARQFDMVLESEGVKPVKSLGEKFDPSLHEAVEVVKDSSRENGTIVEEVRRGYTFKGHLLRAARVKVVSNEAVEATELKQG